MKILIISDLHLCDTRNDREFDLNRLEKLADFIRTGKPDAVLNLGDTVSRREFLRADYVSEAAAFPEYLNWRKQFSIPFVECAITRELEFFSSLVGAEADSIQVFQDDTAILTLTPRKEAGHRPPA